MAKIDSAYNYFLTTYGKDMGTRYEPHKRSELRSTYNSILKSNKESPLYKITQTGDVAKFAIDIKEQANSIHNRISSLTQNGDDIASMLDKKTATSSDEQVITAKFIGNDQAKEMPSFQMEIKKLAKPQTNRGNFLNPKGKDFESGTYSFDLDTPSNSYEFQFNVNDKDTNLDVQQKLYRLFNSSDVGLTAEIVTNDNNQTALSVSSKATGLSDAESNLFNISSETSFDTLNKLGINNITEPASNSLFELNGSEHTSLSNTFTINNAFEVNLKDVSDSPVTIGFKADTDAIADGVQELIDSYNGMIAVGMKYSDAHSNNKLLNEVRMIGDNMAVSLEEVGITPDETGMMTLDREQMAKALTSEAKQQHFNTLDKFKNNLKREANKISINPMNYVNKVIVEYKNPGKTLAYPYAPSAYSGMLIDQAL